MVIHGVQTLYASIDASLQSTLVKGTTKAMLGLGAIFGTFWLLNFTLRSISWLYQGMTVAFKDVVIEIAKVAFIAGCAWNITWYVETIVPVVTGFPPWMGGLLSGQDGTQVTQIDSLISTYVDTLEHLIKAMKFSLLRTSLSQVYLGIQAVVLYLLAGIPFILVAVGTLLLLKAATTVMLAVGPLLIAFALFNQTKQWFWGWVSLIAGFMLTEVLFSVVFALEISFINTVVIKKGVIDTSLAGNIMMLVYFASFTYLVTEMPNYAASVMGGTPISTSGIVGILSKGTGATAVLNGARGTRNLLEKMKGKSRNNIQ